MKCALVLAFKSILPFGLSLYPQYFWLYYPSLITWPTSRPDGTPAGLGFNCSTDIESRSDSLLETGGRWIFSGVV